jgi:hypothetical protein
MLRSKYKYIAPIFLLILIGSFLSYYVLKGSDTLQLKSIELIADPIEKQNALRSYWGRKLTHQVYYDFLGIKISDEGVKRYVLRRGSIDGGRSSIATAYFIGTQKDSPLPAQYKKVLNNFERFYSGNKDSIALNDRKTFIEDLIRAYSPSTGFTVNGVYLIQKEGSMFADFDGIHIPIDLSFPELEAILSRIQPKVDSSDMPKVSSREDFGLVSHQ